MSCFYKLQIHQHHIAKLPEKILRSFGRHAVVTFSLFAYLTRVNKDRRGKYPFQK